MTEESAAYSVGGDDSEKEASDRKKKLASNELRNTNRLASLRKNKKNKVVIQLHPDVLSSLKKITSEYSRNIKFNPTGSLTLEDVAAMLLIDGVDLYLTSSSVKITETLPPVNEQ